MDKQYSMDMISQLPQSMLNHILSFLSQKEAFQTCVLSKSWRYLGSTRPTIEFRQSGFKGNKIPFVSALDQTLQRYHDQKLSVQEFCLEMSEIGNDLILFEKLITLVLMDLGVKTFNLSSMSFKFVFAMPSAVFQAKSLKELYLYKCKLNQISNTEKVMFKNLQTLSLHFVCIEKETLERILSSCPLIQYLVIHYCKGLRNIKVSNAHNLKNVCCATGVYGANDHIIEIDVPSTLEIIRIGHCSNWFLYNSNNNTCFTHLKSLYLSYKRLSAKSFDYFSSNFPCLEELELCQCHGCKEFQLSSRSIKRLIIYMRSDSSIKAFIDAANILYFKFTSNHLPSITFTTTSSEWQSHIDVSYLVYHDPTWLVKLKELLKGLSRSQISLNMDHYPVTGQKIEDTYGGRYEPVVVEHLNFGGSYLCSRFPALLNCLFLTCRPRYICLYFFVDDLRLERRRKDNRLAEFLKGEMSQCNFWRQDLEELSIQVSDENRKEWYPVQGTSLIESAVSNNQNIFFRLKWRDSY